MSHRRILFAALLCLPWCGSAFASNGQQLPAVFDSQRVFVVPETLGGQPIRFFTDTGGGGNLICRAAAERAGLKLTPFTDPELEAELGKELAKSNLPKFRAERAVPPNGDGNDQLLVHACRPQPGTDATTFGEGLLSNRWFAGRVWTWDYPGEHLTLEGTDYTPGADAVRVPIGFQAGPQDFAGWHMPRITVEIDGKPLDLLLDTGATTVLAAPGIAAVGDGRPATRATSFIAASQLRAWHAAHPDWRMVQGAEAGTNAPMIEVPAVDVGGSTVGPVWFTGRGDAQFHEMMSSMMDGKVEGALGGNALGHFVLTLDYPKAVAYFRCVRDCKPAPLTPRSAN